jgi:hypothetical protein
VDLSAGGVGPGVAPFGRCVSAPVSPYAGPRFHNPGNPELGFRSFSRLD